MRTEMQATSLESYNEIKRTLGFKQQTVFSNLSLLISATNSELSVKLGWSINTITPRIFELREKGLVTEACKRVCAVTGRTAIAWRIKESHEIKEKQMELNFNGK